MREGPPIEQPESRKEKVIEARLMHGRTIVEFEKYLHGTDDPSLEDFAEKSDLNQCSEKVQEYIRRAFENYQERVEQIDQAAMVLKEHFQKLIEEIAEEIESLEQSEPHYESEGKIYREKMKLSEDEIKKKLDARRKDQIAGLKDERGKIEAISNQSELFHEALFGRNYPGTPFLTRPVEVKHGMVILFAGETARNKLRQMKKSSFGRCGGFYKDKYKFAEGAVAPLLVIGDENPENIQYTLTHEFQHNANRLVFEVTDEEHTYMRQLKDEFLAFFRDGKRSPEEIDHSLSGFYLKGYFGANTDFRRLIPYLKTINRVSEAAEHLLDYLPDEQRTEIVFSVIDVPFEKLPKWLNEMAEYFKKRKNRQ
ncbi:MAG: hypothetical protein ABH846_04195 [Patescibacteria group bacterium]